jgi:bis(5'-adenosyl)-triphosphatase
MVGSNIQSVNNCAFCKDSIAEMSFYSTSKFSALYNIAPILPGHSLIIPNIHYESLFLLSDDELCEMMIFARKVTAFLKTVFDSDGFDWTIQDGVAAGQTIPHLHLHIIPRRPLDLNAGNEWYSKIPQSEQLILDSQNRERLNEPEYIAITARLREAAISLLK